MSSERMNENRWERAVPVFGVPVMTRTFLVLLALTLMALVLTGYRELAGLGPVSGMNDAFGWGIWKTFNVMVLTALGSGAFAIGIAAWVFRRKKLHSLMRMALLTSFLAYACGLLLLGIDAGRPWNFYWIVFPWKWNMHSPLAEVAICMSIYAMIPLAVENLPPVLERLWYFDARLRPGVEKAERRLHSVFPWVIAAGLFVARNAPIVSRRTDATRGTARPPAVANAIPSVALPRRGLLHVVRLCRWNDNAVLPGLERAMDMEVLDEAASITRMTYLCLGWVAVG